MTSNTEKKEFTRELLQRVKDAVLKFVDGSNPERELLLQDIQKFLNMLDNGMSDIPEDRMQTFRGRLMSFGPDVIGEVLSIYEEEQNMDELLAAAQNVVEQLNGPFPWISKPTRKHCYRTTVVDDDGSRHDAIKIPIGDDMKTTFSLTDEQATIISNKLKDVLANIVQKPDGYEMFVDRTPHWLDDEVYIYVYKKVE